MAAQAAGSEFLHLSLAVADRALACALARDVKRVDEDASVMTEVGMVEKTPDGKLVVPFDEIRADFVMKAAA